MFIHWGVYSTLGRGEWVFYQEHMTCDEYAQFAKAFQPRNYHPADWVALAQDSGMKYVVLTTRHHDGFCLFDSAASDFTSVKTGPGRDLVAEFADACHSAGMRMGFYYSLEDWRFPGQLPHLPRKADDVYAPMVEQAHAQVRELCSNYGKVDLLWYDGGFPAGVWRPEELNAMARSLQPGIVINDRAGTPEDFGTPENVIVPQERPWEACYTMNDSWGYATYDLNYKPPRELLRLLATCAAHGGNLLLNIGPDGDGNVPVEAVRSLRIMGQWLRANGKAIYGAVRSPVPSPALGWTSRVGDRVYLLVQRWPGSELALGWCGGTVKAARVLASGQEARVEQRADRVWLRGLPAYPPDPYLSVIELEFDGEPRESNPAYS